MIKIPLSSLLRTLFWGAAGLSLIAVGLGRYAAPAKLPVHEAAPVRYHGVNTRCFMDREAQPCFLDRETGQLLQIPLPADDSIDYAVCSPWRDERGQYQMVSRWMKRQGKESSLLPQEFGLARFTLPEGRLIDQVMLEQLPIGEPCWIPDGTPRILFAAGDGGLYRYSFEEPLGGPAGEAQERGQARRLTWRITPPGTGLVYVRDLIWPGEKALGGRLIASICYRVREGDQVRMAGPEIWWLELSGDVTTIEAAGRLTPPETPEAPAPAPGSAPEAIPAAEERLPNVAQTFDGGLSMAYLRRNGGQGRWELRVAPLTIDPVTGAPSVRPGSSRRMGRGFISSAPAFSIDGLWVYGIPGHELSGPRLLPWRYSVASALAAPGGGIARLGDAARPQAPR